jgi:hypothetical protein
MSRLGTVGGFEICQDGLPGVWELLAVGIESYRIRTLIDAIVVDDTHPDRPMAGRSKGAAGRVRPVFVLGNIVIDDLYVSSTVGTDGEESRSHKYDADVGSVVLTIGFVVCCTLGGPVRFVKFGMVRFVAYV